MTRLEANRAILSVLSEVVEQFPDWRFTQVMENIGLVEDVDARWYEEPEKTLKAIEQQRKRNDV